MKIRKAVIPVAGLGTRGLPFTKEVPKELTPILDSPTILWIVEEAIASGIEQVIFITSKGKTALEDFFDPSPLLEGYLEKKNKGELLERVRRIGQLCEVISVRQKEPLGLGHAVYCARHVIGRDEFFGVCLGDEIFPHWKPENQKNPALKQLLELAQAMEKSVVGVIPIEPSEASSYGIIDIGTSADLSTPKAVLRTVEKPKPENAPSNYAVVGRYVFSAELFEVLKSIKPGVGGELQLTDGMDGLSKAGTLLATALQGVRYDMGNLFQFVKAQIEYGLTRPELQEKLKSYLKNFL